MIRKIITISVFVFASTQYCYSQLDANSVIGLPNASDDTEMNNLTGANEGSLLYNSSQKNIFFFDGTNWTSPSSLGSNLYSINGTLSSSRTVNGGGNSLTLNNLNTFQLFTNTASQFFSVGAMQFSSTGSTIQVTGTFGVEINAIANGITLNGNTSVSNNLSVTGSFADSSGSTGTNGQILTSTVTGTQWNDPATAEVVNQVSNYTLTANDNGKVFTFNSTGNLTLTVPSGLPIGFNISIYQINTGRVTISGAGGVSILNRLSRFTTAGQHAGAGLVSTSTNNFHLTGDLRL
ncbi:hypothetical protein SAMN04489761_0224 [Tenacibaculum sp. MAR_2009_124]|uniref:hypothetical protein n=1 Tax=Tenacibaculum sp. MAR_2009_124 TaxID=1250059 RepID=UPI0008999201|nr:hypothetical protein [Tenacibaculum sp. MAR_2009_124]SEB37097.1 hypothetical protein SAMN04489761_0224 [Tenacibaculum sp. MAR_2009_124]